MIWRIGSLRHAAPANMNEPAAGARTRVTRRLRAAGAPDGTEIAMTCENIPRGISPEDNAMGCRSSLQNLASRLEPKD
jgi:hypothetical protein